MSWPATRTIKLGGESSLVDFYQVGPEGRLACDAGNRSRNYFFQCLWGAAKCGD
jgi:hypothetical protein